MIEPCAAAGADMVVSASRGMDARTNARAIQLRLVVVVLFIAFSVFLGLVGRPTGALPDRMLPNGAEPKQKDRKIAGLDRRVPHPFGIRSLVRPGDRPRRRPGVFSPPAPPSTTRDDRGHCR